MIKHSHVVEEDQTIMIIPAFFSTLAAPEKGAMQHPAVANTTSLLVTPHDLRVTPVDMGNSQSYHLGWYQALGNVKMGLAFSIMWFVQTGPRSKT